MTDPAFVRRAHSSEFALTGLKAAAAGFGLNTNELALGFSFAAAEAEASVLCEGVGEVARGMLCAAVSGTGIEGGLRLAGLKGGISWMFMTILRVGCLGPGVALDGSGDLDVAAGLALSTLRASAAALADSRAEAAFASIAFCLSSSLARIGRISLGIGRGICSSDTPG
jgi:hypothetical protein